MSDVIVIDLHTAYDNIMNGFINQRDFGVDKDEHCVWHNKHTKAQCAASFAMFPLNKEYVTKDVLMKLEKDNISAPSFFILSAVEYGVCATQAAKAFITACQTIHDNWAQVSKNFQEVCTYRMDRKTRMDVCLNTIGTLYNNFKVLVDSGVLSNDKE